MPPSKCILTLGLCPVVSDLTQVGCALAQAKAGSLVLHRTLGTTKLLGDESVRIGAVDLPQSADLRGRPVLHTTGGRDPTSRSCGAILTGLPSGRIISSVEVWAMRSWTS